MTARGQLRRAAPWVSCAVSLGLLSVAGGIRWALRNDSAVGYDDWLDGTLAAFGVAGMAVVGALIATRLPANPYGWVWCGVGLAYGVGEFPPQGTSDVLVAAVTLAVAALTGPARRRIQTAVDRRFDRARYDAERAVAAYAARLRTQVDLDETTAGLRATVTETVTPTRVGVWLRGPTGVRKV